MEVTTVSCLLDMIPQVLGMNLRSKKEPYSLISHSGFSYRFAI